VGRGSVPIGPSAVASRREIWDETCRGLVLLVRASGAASWTYRYRPKDGGARRRVKLGDYPSVGPSEARKRADKYRGKVAGGADPQGEAKARRHAPTLSHLIDRNLDEAVAPHKKPGTLALYRTYLRSMIEPEQRGCRTSSAAWRRYAQSAQLALGFRL
jgi:hypothetical protein